jgi:hypothetical protein
MLSLTVSSMGFFPFASAFVNIVSPSKGEAVPAGSSLTLCVRGFLIYINWIFSTMRMSSSWYRCRMTYFTVHQYGSDSASFANYLFFNAIWK